MRSNTHSRRGYMSAGVKPAVFIAIIFAALLALAGVSFRDIPTAQAVSSTIVISQVYGGAGCGTAGCSTYKNDYIELFNRGTAAVSLNGWSVQYAAQTGTSWQVTNLTNVTLQPGQYYLVAQAGNANGVNNLPAQDATGNVSMSATSAKVALVNTTTALSGRCGNGATTTLPASVIDFVGYGTGADCNDAGATTGGTGNAPAPSTTTADVRAGAGCTDTDNNSTDFTATTPNPRNTATATAPCAPPLPNLTVNNVTQAETDSGTTTFTFTVSLSAPAGPGGVTFDIATADGTAQDDNPATEDNDYAAQSLTGQTIPAGSSTYAFNVTVNGDTAIEPSETFFVNVTNVTGANVTDGQGQGTIQNDDSPNLSINDVSQEEGNTGSSNFTFTVSLSAPAGPGGVSFSAQTAPGTATGSATSATEFDYTDALFNETIPEGQSSITINVPVRGDTNVEPNETFFVNITSATGAAIGDAQGQGTIVNDDFPNFRLISEVQGSTPTEDTDTASPHAGQTVTVRGIVTLLKSNGFFLQEEVSDNDSDPNTSEGIFVFTSAAPTQVVGNQATVTGTVVEFNGLTEISATNANVITNNTGNGLPTAVTLTTEDLPPTAHFRQPQLEKYEGMRLFAASLTTATHNDGFFDVPAVITGQPRPLREPGIPADSPVLPDPTTGTPDCCVPVFDLNPQQIIVDTNGRAGSTGEAITSNVVITNLAGPLDFAFGAYRIVSEAALTRTANMSAVPVPTPFSTEFTVAGFNIENFDNNATQRQKAALGIVRVMRLPDIIGHAEIFNLASLQALATEVNSRAVADGHPNPMYEARLIPTPVTGITQNVGFLVKTARVRIDAVTQERATDKYTQPSNGALDDTHDRPPLVLRATVDPAGVNRSVIVVVNHTRSFIDIEDTTGEGQNARAKRKAQAESLAGLFQELQTNNPGVPVIAVGDYNAFQFNNGYDDPISVMKGTPRPDEQMVADASPDVVNPDFFNLIDELPISEQYTFTFDEPSTASTTDYEELTAQALDHVLVNTVAHDINTRIAVARMNADFPEVPAAAFASDATRPERNSDHDAPVAYFTLFAEAQAGQLLINEFRHFGPGGAEDEFVEIYNNTEVEHVVATTDGSAGYSVATAANQTAGTTRCVIPNGTRIPARGYFLCANVDGYSLDLYPSGTARSAFPDAGGEFTDDIPVNAGLALFSTANTANFNTNTRLDAAGPASESNTLYREGAGYPDITFVTTRQYSFFRDLRAGTPKDTNDNAADFLYVNTDGSNDGAGGRLGAPGPQNLSSPTQRNQIIKASLIDPLCSGVGIAVASAEPGTSPDGTPVSGCQNTARDFTPLLATQPNTSASGTFYIRRRFRNTTVQNVTRLRFRVVDITATPQTGTADLRLLSSGAVTYTVGSDPNPVTVQGLMLEELNATPPTQPNGGGFNSSAQCCTSAPGVSGVRTISLAQPLAPNDTIDLQFRFGVMATGAFRFFVNVEAELQAPPMMLIRSKAGAGDSKR